MHIRNDHKNSTSRMKLVTTEKRPRMIQTVHCNLCFPSFREVRHNFRIVSSFFIFYKPTLCDSFLQQEETIKIVHTLNLENQTKVLHAYTTNCDFPVFCLCISWRQSWALDVFCFQIRSTTVRRLAVLP